MNDRISFIIIGKNECKNIPKCIESIKKLNYDNYEIIYIDSNSTDATESILSKYAEVKSYKVTSNIYTAALARDIGVNMSRGEYIFFLDGDMELTLNTDIYYCLDLLKNNEISIVSGELNDIWIKGEVIVNKIENFFCVKEEIEDLKAPGGYFFTTRIDYIKAGGFNKILACNEEVDLFSRYKKNNKRLVRTNKMCCLHNNRKDNREKSHLSRLSTGYYADFWRVIINSVRDGYLKEYLGFRSQITMIRSIVTTLVMFLCILASGLNWMFILIPSAYYILLIFKYRVNIKLLSHNQLNNIMIIVSLLFIGKKHSLVYEVFTIMASEVNYENKTRTYQ